MEEPKGLTEENVGDLSGRFAALGLIRPVGVCLLPNNFLCAESPADLFLAVSAPDIKARLRQAGIPPDRIAPEGVRIPYREDCDSTLVLPALFVAAACVSQNPSMLNVALGVVANYVTEFFKGKCGAKRVKCSVHVEKAGGKKVVKIEYDGSPESFSEFIEAANKAIQ